MSRFVWSSSPPWAWHAWRISFDDGEIARRERVPDPRPYWACEWWTQPDARDGDTYCHLRIVGLEVSWFWKWLRVRRERPAVGE